MKKNHYALALRFYSKTKLRGHFLLWVDLLVISLGRVKGERVGGKERGEAGR